MKTTSIKPRHIALGVALVLAAALAAWGDRTPQGEVAEAVERAPAQQAPARQPDGPAQAARPQPAIARLLPRAALIGDGKERFGAGARELFGRQDWTPPPPPPPPPAPPPPPTAPPMPFNVIGKALEDGAWEVYLASGERTHIAREGALIDGSWRVDRIAPPLMTLTYLPLNQVQQLNIGVFE